jgi:uncharacterized membrane protein YsdA (DUF1294 family)
LIKKLLLLFAVGFLMALTLSGLHQYWHGVIASVYLVMSSVTLIMYKWDKQRAMRKTHQVARIPERILHLLALLCGWPGAIIAQQWFRHKSKKRSFIIVLWVTIIINSLILSYIYHWQWQ